MTNIYLKYNPYTVESELKIDGVPVKTPNKLADFLRERLQVWVERLMPILCEVCNDDEYIIDFYGTRLDYMDLLSCVADYCNVNKNTKVSYSFTEARESKDRFKELIHLFNEMQKDCPFEDLTTKQIKENFENAISSEFEISILATMSTGKSTLINSLLGRELLPFKNEACTATIVRIKDEDGLDHFEGICKDQQGNIVGEYKNLLLKDMKSINEDPNIAYVDIRGDIAFVNSEGIQLVLVDTPGPDNARTEEHKDYTYRVIKEKTKPMVLYVLNVSQLEIDADKELLSAVSEAMKVGGKQSKDRFLFAINKMDKVDPDKEPIQKILNDVKKYLESFGIVNPNIFPVSAELAKLIKMKEAGQEISDEQKNTLDYYDYFIEEEQMHLSEQATLSKDNMMRIKGMIEEAQKNEDEYKEALIHTGIPAIELAIEEYLQKYAYTTKVKSAVDTFKKKIEEKKIYSNMMNSLQSNNETRKQMNLQLRLLKKQLEEGETRNVFRQRIENLDMTSQAKEKIKVLRSKINEIAINKNQKDKMTIVEITQMINALDFKIRQLQSNVKTELEEIINDVINQGGKRIIADYRKQMRNLILNGDLKNADFSTKCSVFVLDDSIPDAQEIIDQYKYTERVDTGIDGLRYNTRHRWWDIFEWFEPRFVIERLTKNVEMVDANKVYDEFVAPIIQNFFTNLENAEKTANEEAGKFKKFFLNELSSLEAILRKKVEEVEELTKDQASLENKIKEDQNKIKWLKGFMVKLDSILEI